MKICWLLFWWAHHLMVHLSVLTHFVVGDEEGYVAFIGKRRDTKFGKLVLNECFVYCKSPSFRIEQYIEQWLPTFLAGVWWIKPHTFSECHSNPFTLSDLLICSLPAGLLSTPCASCCCAPCPSLIYCMPQSCLCHLWHMCCWVATPT